MELFVDGNRVDVAGDPSAGVKTVLEGLSEFLRGQGRTMIAIEFDGREMDPKKLAGELSDEPAPREIRVTSAAIADLAGHALAEVREALTSLPDACRQLAAVFQGTAPQDGFEPFAKLAAIWGDIKEREAMVVNVLGESSEALTIDGESLEALHNSLNDFLKECESALQKSDYVLLGDLLEYELAPRAEQESAIVELLQARVQERFSKA